MSPAGASTAITGRAFFVTSNGYLLTCDHIVSCAHKVEVLYNNRYIEAAVISEDKRRDIALIMVEIGGTRAAQYPALPIKTHCVECKLMPLSIRVTAEALW